MHYTVMKKESIDALNIQEDGIYVDCTLGYAGDSQEILKRVKRGFLFAFDQDREAISWSREKLKSIAPNFEIIKSNFDNLATELHKRNIYEVSGFIFDLGVSSPQLDEDYRGFSYHKDARLDMRMDLDSKLSAYEVVNNYSEADLRRIIYQYGEEKYASSIAKNIIKARKEKAIVTTFELVDIIKNSLPAKAKQDHHPARKTFQAIRIEVNHELDSLEKGLRAALKMLKIGGRIVVITFHSLEDRIVKNIFREMTEVDSSLKDLPEIPNDLKPNYRLINNNVIIPSEKELKENKRSRSSKLRVIERIK